MKLIPKNSLGITGKVSSLLGIGNSLLQKEKFNESINFFKQVLKIEPKNPIAFNGTVTALENIGESKLNMGNYTDSLKIFQQILND